VMHMTAATAAISNDDGYFDVIGHSLEASRVRWASALTARLREWGWGDWPNSDADAMAPMGAPWHGVIAQWRMDPPTRDAPWNGVISQWRIEPAARGASGMA
jgi:hypothetical protein